MSGAFISFMNIIIGLLKLHSIRKKSEIISINGTKIYLTDKDVNPFTFMNKIIWTDWEDAPKVTFFHRYIRYFKHQELRYEKKNVKGLIKLILKNQKQGIP